MKALKCFLVLFSFVGSMLVGCSDKSQSPVSPDDQNLLQKNITYNFTGLNVPTGTTDPGITKSPDGKLMMLKYQGTTYFTQLSGDGPDYLTGPGEIEINGTTDLRKKTGQWHGKFVLKPEGVPEGLWQMTWHGPSVFSPIAWNGTPGWILSLTMVGHGEGDVIHGMQIRTENTVYCNPDFTAYYGDLTGTITSH